MRQIVSGSRVAIRISDCSTAGSTTFFFFRGIPFRVLYIEGGGSSIGSVESLEITLGKCDIMGCVFSLLLLVYIMKQ